MPSDLGNWAGTKNLSRNSRHVCDHILAALRGLNVHRHQDAKKNKASMSLSIALTQNEIITCNPPTFKLGIISLMSRLEGRHIVQQYLGRSFMRDLLRAQSFRGSIYHTHVPPCASHASNLIRVILAPFSASLATF